jgi:hypothetical protein
MKRQLIVAGAAAAAAAGALALATDAAADPNAFLLDLEGVSNPPATLPDTPLGMVPDGNFYDVVTSGSTASGQFVVTDPTLAAKDLLDSSVITHANQVAGLGDTNGYIGLSPTSTPDLFSFNDAEGVDYDHGLQALMTAFNQPWISLEDALNGTSGNMFDPAELNLDPAELTATQSANLMTDLTTAFSDFSAAATLAGL